MKLGNMLLINFIFLILSFNIYSQENKIIYINIEKQMLYLVSNNDTIAKYKVSTSKYGVGNFDKSEKTPLGKHKISSKYGENMPIGSTFEGRIFNGKTSEIFKDSTITSDDLVLTRVLRLKGLERGVNYGGDVDTFKRLIYIHGTNEEGLIGTPASHGCIRMKNIEVIELFKIVPVNTIVEIVRR